MNRDDAPGMMYIVFDETGVPIDVYSDEDTAYRESGDDSRVVTYTKA